MRGDCPFFSRNFEADTCEMCILCAMIIIIHRNSLVHLSFSQLEIKYFLSNGKSTRLAGCCQSHPFARIVKYTVHALPFRFMIFNFGIQSNRIIVLASTVKMNDALTGKTANKLLTDNCLVFICFAHTLCHRQLQCADSICYARRQPVRAFIS